MSTKFDHLLATLETRPHPGHERHAASPNHHRAALIGGIIVAVALLGLLVATYPRDDSAPKFRAPSTSLAAEATITKNGVAQDFTSVNAAALSDNLLAH